MGTTMKPGGTGTTMKPAKIDVRLPLHMEPIHYDVELQPNMYNNKPETFTFNGYARIHMKCVAASNNVTLHINKLNITDGSMKFGRQDMSAAPGISSWTIDKERQFLIIYLNDNMEENKEYYVEMRFVGPLKDDLAGLYLSTYEYQNVTKYMATTQLQPTDGRRVFPCFDEPAIKATFNTTLVRMNTTKSISNMPITSTQPRYMATSMLAPIEGRRIFPCFDEPGIKASFNVTLVRSSSTKAISNMPIRETVSRSNGMVADVFERTPKMSVYLLAFIVGDLEFIEKTTSKNIRYRTWSTLGKTDQAQYALETGVKIITYFSDFFEVPFPLPKQDMVAIPDFSAGAMENWGLIIYRETAMLYKPGVSSEGNKQRVAVVVSHELAHQWFGNLVTPSWWDDLWLNEGFASFVEYLGVDHVHPDWKMFDQFVVEDLQDVFDFDGLTTSHPVYVPVGHPDEINEIFDRISYAKGASIIRMMRFFLGDETFRLGLKRYLNSRKFDAAFHDDLWSSLTQQATADSKNIDVKKIMDTWTLQMNYPVVKVTKQGASRLRLTQQRYLRDPTATDPMKYTSKFGYKWTIPFTYTSSNVRDFNQTDADVVWFYKEDDNLNIDASNLPTGENSWILANVQQYGFYRVNYDESNWMALINQLKTDHTVIHPINRAQIINDAWSLAAAGHINMSIALQTVEYLGKEMEFVPRRAANRELENVQRMLSKSDIYGAWKEFIISRVKVPFDILTMDNTNAPHLQSYLRSEVVSVACDYDYQPCVTNATLLFKQWMNNPSNNPIDPGLKTQVYCTAVQYGGIAEWNFAFNQYKTSNVAAEQSRLLRALACTREMWLLNRYLTKAVNQDEIRKQDSLSIIIYVSSHTISRDLTWNFVRENWKKISDDFAVSLFQFTRMIGRVTEAFNTEFDLKQLEAFVKSQPYLGSGQRAFEQAVEKTKSNIKWMKNNYGTIKSWLSSLNFK
ncbi:hypothetical protein LOTGIDRAFT_238559 [Lottia gigantea]|uniref:Aminopeptidase n=1 Tax=Lottia gigantea TaxID=225164 RepID=V4AT03_LOTGI|nr:hypothetical protein LOTGIDRAFT_238559 [Lottia gigantea]ESP00388.1 hypothetical protein LOTGIDRAFT_238559 [Lottia gigantea]